MAVYYIVRSVAPGHYTPSPGLGTGILDTNEVQTFLANAQENAFNGLLDENFLTSTNNPEGVSRNTTPFGPVVSSDLKAALNKVAEFYGLVVGQTYQTGVWFGENYSLQAQSWTVALVNGDGILQYGHVGSGVVDYYAGVGIDLETETGFQTFAGFTDVSGLVGTTTNIPQAAATSGTSDFIAIAQPAILQNSSGTPYPQYTSFGTGMEQVTAVPSVSIQRVDTAASIDEVAEDVGAVVVGPILIYATQPTPAEGNAVGRAEGDFPNQTILYAAHTNGPGHTVNKLIQGATVDEYYVSTDAGVTFTRVSDYAGTLLDANSTSMSIFSLDNGTIWFGDEADSNDIVYSLDEGNSWLEATTSSVGLHFTSRIFRNPATGNFLATTTASAGGGGIMVSSDGANWVDVPAWSVTSPMHMAGGVLNGNPILLGADTYSTTGNSILYDLTDESVAEIPVFTFNDGVEYDVNPLARQVVAIGDGLAVVTGGESASGFLPIYASTDGTTWTKVADIPESPDVVTVEYIRDIDYDPINGMFYLATNDRILRSPDAVTWTTLTTHTLEYGEAGNTILGFWSVQVIDAGGGNVNLSVVSRNNDEGVAGADKLYYYPIAGEVVVEPPVLPPPVDDNDDGVDDSLQNLVPALVDPANLGVILRSENYTGVLNNLIDALNVSLPLLVDSDQAEALDAPLNANLNRLTNLAPATENNDLVTLAQVKAALGIS